MPINRQILSTVCEQVYRRFPQVAGSQPGTQDRPDGNVLLIFRGSGKAADGHVIPHTVRVVVNPSGKIVKTSTSR